MVEKGKKKAASLKCFLVTASLKPQHYSYDGPVVGERVFTKGREGDSRFRKESLPACWIP